MYRLYNNKSTTVNFEVIVQTCIMNTIRDNIPVEQLLKQYIDETQEVDVEKVEKVVNDEKSPSEEVKNSDESQKVEEEEDTKPSVESSSSDVEINLDQEPVIDPPPPSNENVIISEPEKEEPPVVSDFVDSKPNEENRRKTKYFV